jgi:hypothetical protein
MDGKVEKISLTSSELFGKKNMSGYNNFNVTA